jgi:hypothetical protein
VAPAVDERLRERAARAPTAPALVACAGGHRVDLGGAGTADDRTALAGVTAATGASPEPAPRSDPLVELA